MRLVETDDDTDNEAEPSAVSVPDPPDGTEAVDGTDERDAYEDVQRNRVAGLCERCGTWLAPDAGEVVVFGSREVFRCTPACR